MSLRWRVGARQRLTREAPSIHRPVDCTWCRHASWRQSDEGDRLPMTMWLNIHQPLAACATAVKPHHLGVGQKLSMNTSPAGSNRPCSRIQRRRARATSARSCSIARRLFFERDLVSLEKSPDRRATARNFELAHHADDLVRRQVGLQFDQRQQKVRVLLQWRRAPTAGLGGTAASRESTSPRSPPYWGLLRSARLPRREAPLSTQIDNSQAHVRRICLRHRPASQSQMNDERLTHLTARESPVSITPELALARRLSKGRRGRKAGHRPLVSIMHARPRSPLPCVALNCLVVSGGGGWGSFMARRASSGARSAAPRRRR